MSKLQEGVHAGIQLATIGNVSMLSMVVVFSLVLYILKISMTDDEPDSWG